VWKNVRSGDFAAQFNTVAEPLWLERSYASSIVCAPGIANYRIVNFRDSDSHENDLVLDQIMSSKPVEGLSSSDANLITQGIQALLGIDAGPEPQFHSLDRAKIALLSRKLAAFRNKPKGASLRSQLIATAVSLRLSAEIDPDAAVPELVNASRWITPLSPVIGQNCIILAVQLERKRGKKKEAHHLWEVGRAKFLANNPTGLAGFWASEDWSVRSDPRRSL
jgi:hypothetical protein